MGPGRSFQGISSPPGDEPVDNSPTREALSVNSSPPGDEPVDNSPTREALSVNSSPPGDEHADNSPTREALSVNSSPPGDEHADDSPTREALSVNSPPPGDEHADDSPTREALAAMNSSPSGDERPLALGPSAQAASSGRRAAVPLALSRLRRRGRRLAPAPRACLASTACRLRRGSWPGFRRARAAL